MQRTDSELYAAWAAGDNHAGDELVQRYYGRVHRLIASKVVDGVEDLVQAIFLATLESQSRFREDSSFSTFLYSVARHKLFHHYRARNKDGRNTPLGEYSAIDLGPSPSSMVSRKDKQGRLLLALNELPVDSQMALELYYWEGMSASEIGGVLGLKEGGVRSRLRRAKENLRELMEPPAGSGNRVSEETAEPTEETERWAESMRGTFESLGETYSRPPQE